LVFRFLRGIKEITKMSYKIEAIEGVGPAFGKKLREAGVKSTAQMLTRGATRKGRKELAEAAAIEEGNILRWANISDLMRIKGVASEFSELLEAAGVDTVKELKMRRADNLHKAMADANEKRKLVRQLPSAKQVSGWIEQAKTLAPVMQY
jgi:predicted flap endonuclease-1-like 5' DNA nuclease